MQLFGCNGIRKEVHMNAITYTMQELQTMKFYELPNCIYEAIVRELRKRFGVMLEKLIPIFDKASICELDQYVDIYKFIVVI